MTDEIKEARCKKCDYRNNNVAIDDKKPNCIGLDSLLGCKIYIKTLKLESRIKYLNGEIGPIYISYSDGQGEIYTFND